MKEHFDLGKMQKDLDNLKSSMTDAKQRLMRLERPADTLIPKSADKDILKALGVPDATIPMSDVALAALDPKVREMLERGPPKEPPFPRMKPSKAEYNVVTSDNDVLSKEDVEARTKAILDRASQGEYPALKIPQEKKLRPEYDFEDEFPGLRGKFEVVRDYIHPGVAAYLLWPGEVRAHCLDKQKVKEALEEELDYWKGWEHYPEYMIERLNRIMKELGL